jgi:hypothetical protein
VTKLFKVAQRHKDQVVRYKDQTRTPHKGQRMLNNGDGMMRWIVRDKPDKLIG